MTDFCWLLNQKYEGGCAVCPIWNRELKLCCLARGLEKDAYNEIMENEK